MIDALIRARFVFLAIVAVALVYLTTSGRRVGYEQSIKSFFADDDPAILAYRDASAAFGDDNFVFVCYDDPALLTPGGMDRVAELAGAVGSTAIPGVLRVESLDAMPLLWRVDDELLRLDKFPGLLRDRLFEAAKAMIRRTDPSAAGLTIGAAVRSASAPAIADLKSRLVKHPLFRGTLVDGLARVTAVVVRLRKTEEHNVMATVGALRVAADAFAKKHTLGPAYIVGPPVLLADGFTAIERDGRRLAAVGMGLIALVTLTATRSLWWALVPLISGWTVWLAAEDILSRLDMRLSLSGGPLVAQIIVLTMPAASHLAIHFRDALRRDPDKTAAARATLRDVSVPIFWTAVTGAIGYGALVTSNVVPIRQFGWIMGTCTLLASLLVMAISPAAMRPPFRLEIPVRLGSRSRVGGGVGVLTGLALRRPGLIVATVLLVVAPVVAGVGRLSYESNYINAFRPETRVVRDYHEVETRLGGIGVVEVIAPIGPAIGADALAKLRRFEDEYADRVAPDPGNVRPLSLATVLDPDRRLRQAAGSDEAFARVLAMKLALIAESPQAELLKGFWSAGAGEARILVRLGEQQDAAVKDRTFREAEALARAEFWPKSYLTGLSFLMTKTVQGVILTQWTTFLWSAGGILLMLTIALRGPLLAALAILPTLLAVGLVVGLMGWLGIKLDIATALVASVALGLSVDDTFHCLLQFRRERPGRTFREALLESYAVTGPGVLLSSLAVAVGFAALRLSEFEPFVNFGTMVGIATAGSTLGNLLLLPACLTLVDRVAAGRPAPEPAAIRG